VAERFNFGGLGIADERQLQTVEGTNFSLSDGFPEKNYCERM